MYFFLYYNKELKKDLKWELGYKIQCTQPLVTDGVSHLNFTACISFCHAVFHFVELICFLPLQDGNKECLSDVDDLGNWHKKCLWRGLWETFLGRISRILPCKNAKNVWIECDDI